MTELERELVALGAALDVPVDAHLAVRVHASIVQLPARPRRWHLVVAAVLALAGAAIVAEPVVADWLRVGGVEVRQEPPPTTRPSPVDRLELGQPTTLAAALTEVAFDVVVPAELGAPDEVWIDRSHRVPIVWLAYRPRPGLPEGSATGYGALLAQAELTVVDDLLATKFAEPNTTIERVEVGTGRALWVAGTHYLGLRDRDGSIVVDRLRLSDSVLLWERGRVTMRLESGLGRDDSLSIARSTP